MLKVYIIDSITKSYILNINLVRPLVTEYALRIKLVGGTSSAHSFNPFMHTLVTRSRILIFNIYDSLYVYIYYIAHISMNISGFFFILAHISMNLIGESIIENYKYIQF